MAKVYGKKLVNGAAAHHGETQRALRRLTRDTEGRAKANLSEARGSTRWHKIFGPGHLTWIDSTQSSGKYGDIDYLVTLHAPNAMAIEFGHDPSGVFGPDGMYGHLDTKAPDPLYILIRAALGGHTI